jgi:undecaprenyl-diphosphatase
VSLWEAVVLGTVQGLTEFLPVSSSAHLVLVPWALGWADPGLTFDVAVHVGTLGALLLYFGRDLAALARRIASGATDGVRLLLALAAGTVPGAAAGYFAKGFFEGLFARPDWVGVFLLGTAALLAAAERAGRRSRSLEGLGVPDAVWVGLAQAAAIAPGISRSGATIAAGLLLGFTREAAARFSFLLAIPIMVGAGVHQFLGLRLTGAAPVPWETLLTGFVAALATGYAAIGGLLRYLRRRSLSPFALYCLLLGLLVVARTWLP